MMISLANIASVAVLWATLPPSAPTLIDAYTDYLGSDVSVAVRPTALPVRDVDGAIAFAHDAAHDRWGQATFPPLLVDAEADASALLVRFQELLPSIWEQDETGLLHRQSGMRCDFSHRFNNSDGATIFTLGLQGVRVFNPNGSDVGCNYLSADGAYHYTVFASRWPRVGLRDHFENAVALMGRDVPITGEPQPIIALTPTIEDRPSQIEGETLAAAFNTPEIEGRIYQTALWLNKTGDWHVKMRGTYTPPDEAGQVGGALLHIRALVEVDGFDPGISNQLVSFEPEAGGN